MYFSANNSILYSDTLVSDVFIAEYMPSLDGDFVKVYIYSLFLSKHNKFATAKEFAKKLNMEIPKVKDALTLLDTMGVLSMGAKKIEVIDLKQKEIEKIYKLKTTSSPEQALKNSELNKKRNTTISAINNKFFQGLMPPSWYTDIDMWFEIYKFDEDVMYTLFHHCYDHNGLGKNYIEKVAQSWHSKSIKTSIDLDKYYMEYQKVKDIKSQITKKLKLGRMLTTYEDDIVEKWTQEYKYDFEIIEIVLKRTTGKSNPNFNYINTVLTDWHKNGLKTKEEIAIYTKSKNDKSSSQKQKVDNNIPQHVNFDQREYTAEDFEKYYYKVSE